MMPCDWWFGNLIAGGPDIWGPWWVSRASLWASHVSEGSGQASGQDLQSMCCVTALLGLKILLAKHLLKGHCLGEHSCSWPLSGCDPWWGGLRRRPTGLYCTCLPPENCSETKSLFLIPWEGTLSPQGLQSGVPHFKEILYLKFTHMKKSTQ